MIAQLASVSAAGRDFIITIARRAERATRRAELYAMLDTLHFEA
jgi:hypothetical protein